MGLETGVNFIDDLVAANPLAGDDPSEGDDHIRALKTAVQGSFTSLGSAAVTTTAAELNQLDAVTVGGTSSGDIVTIDGTQTITNKEITSPTINGQSGYGKVWLDDPVLLVSQTTVDAGGTGDWNTHDMSAGNGSAAATAGAVAAIIRVRSDCVNNAGANTNSSTYIRKKGLSGAVSEKWEMLANHFSDVNNTSVRAIYTNTIEVGLDGNSDFEYQHTEVTGSSRTIRYWLVGYYV